MFGNRLNCMHGPGLERQLDVCDLGIGSRSGWNSLKLHNVIKAGINHMAQYVQHDVSTSRSSSSGTHLMKTEWSKHRVIPLIPALIAS